MNPNTQNGSRGKLARAYTKAGFGEAAYQQRMARMGLHPGGRWVLVGQGPLTTNQHILHLLLTVFTAGLWAPVWIIRAVQGNKRRVWEAPPVPWPPSPPQAQQGPPQNGGMGETEAVLSCGVSGWPVMVHHASRNMHWRVLGIVEPDTAAASPAHTGRYVLLVHGPFAYVTGGEGEQYMTAAWHDGQWWITPNTTGYPRRGIPPGE